MAGQTALARRDVVSSPRPGFKMSVNNVLDRYPVSRSTLNAWIAAGLFPKPLRIDGRVFWDEQDIADFERKVK